MRTPTSNQPHFKSSPQRIREWNPIPNPLNPRPTSGARVYCLSILNPKPLPFPVGLRSNPADPPSLRPWDPTHSPASDSCHPRSATPLPSWDTSKVPRTGPPGPECPRNTERSSHRAARSVRGTGTNFPTHYSTGRKRATNGRKTTTGNGPRVACGDSRPWVTGSAVPGVAVGSGRVGTVDGCRTLPSGVPVSGGRTLCLQFDVSVSGRAPSVVVAVGA